MKSYIYKMQWLLSLNGDFTQTQKQARKKVTDFIKAVGSKSFTVIYFRDNDLKVVDSWSNMVSYSTTENANKALIDLIKGIKQHSNIQYIEFLKK